MQHKALTLIDVAAVLVIGTLVTGLGLVLQFSGQLAQEVAAIESRSPILLTRFTALPTIRGGVQYVPLSWTPSALDSVGKEVAELGQISPVAVSSAYVEADYASPLRTKIVGLSREALAALAPSSGCSPGVLIVDSGYPQSRATVRVDGVATSLVRIERNHAMAALAGERDEPIALRCLLDDSPHPQAVFVPVEGEGRRAYQQIRVLTERASPHNTAIAPPSVRVELVSDLLRKRIDSQYGWIGALQLSFGLMLVFAAAAFSIFDAARTRPNYAIKRALGSQMLDLVVDSASRITKRVGLAGCIGAAAAWVVASIAFEGKGLVGVPLALAVWWLGAWTAACVAHAAYVLIGVDRRTVVSSNAAGSRIGSVASGAALMAGSAVLLTLILFSAEVMTYSFRLSREPLGYQPDQLMVLEAIPPPRVSVDAARTYADLGQVVATVGNGQATVICEAPWRLDSFLAQPMFSSTGITIVSGPGVARVLGLTVAGSDLSPRDMRVGNALLAQTSDPAFEKSLHLFGHVVGRIGGLKVGAISLHDRDIVFQAMGSSPCHRPLIVMRVSPGQATAATESVIGLIRTKAKRYRILDPVSVGSEIEKARAPLTNLRWISSLTLLVSVLMMVVTSAMLSGAYVRLNLRTVAIRHALGESPLLAALNIGLRCAVLALAGSVVGMLAWPYLRPTLGQVIPAFTVSGLTQWVATLGVAIAAGGVAIRFALRSIGKSDLTSVLRID